MFTIVLFSSFIVFIYVYLFFIVFFILFFIVLIHSYYKSLIMDKTYKKKSKNFSFAEEEELMNLVSKYWAVIQCKTTDHINNMKKKEYWSKIESEFNAVVSEHYRSADVLKCKFENISRRAQKKRSQNGKQLTDTGGGQANLVEYCSVDERVLALLGRRATGLPSKWCDDEDVGTTIKTNEVDDKSLIEEYEFEEVAFDDDVVEASSVHADSIETGNKQLNYPNYSTQPETSWAKYTPGMLRQQKSKPLCSSTTIKENGEIPFESQTKRREVFQDKLILWAQEKASLTVQEVDFKREEVEVKRELWKVKISREKELSELLKEEVKDRIKFQAEKHAAEMELIALQKAKIIL